MLPHIYTDYTEFTGPEREVWMKEAICPNIDSDVFFPVHKGNQYNEARTICSECPVREECLEYAMRTEGNEAGLSSRIGMYGGMSPAERVKLGKQRRKEIRRKNKGYNE